MFDRYDYIKLITSVRGEGTGDNIIVVRVDEYQHVDNKLIAMQGEIYTLGEIEDYILPWWNIIQYISDKKGSWSLAGFITT